MLAFPSYNMWWQSSGGQADDKDRGRIIKEKKSTDYVSFAVGDAGSNSSLGVPVPLEAVGGRVADRSASACSTGERNIENGDRTEPKHVDVGGRDGQASSSHDSTHPTPEDHTAAIAADGTPAGMSHGNSSGISQHDGGINGYDCSSSQSGGMNDPKEKEKQSDDGGSDARAKEAEAAAKAWGITPGRLTMLVRTLVKEADEWGEDVKHLRWGRH